MNRWNIPDWLEREVIDRDRNCVYCGTEFSADAAPRRTRPSWEHIVNDARLVTRENIALCCIGCNASKGTKDLAIWLESSYCKSLGITQQTVASVVKAALAARKAPPSSDGDCSNLDHFSEPQEALRVLANLGCPWGVAGGWAIDLFLNRLTRKHKDIEVAVFREDQFILREHLSSRGWSFDYVRAGQLFPWKNGESLALPIHEIWCRIANGTLDRLEVLLNERRGDQFVFRRDPRVRTPIDRTFVPTKSGIPVLAPEIVLLYKAKHPAEPKEQHDFSNVFRELDTNVICCASPNYYWSVVPELRLLGRVQRRRPFLQPSRRRRGFPESHSIKSRLQIA